MNKQETEWSIHVKKQEGSGLSIKTYCEQASLNYDQFRYWRRKYRDQSSMSVARCIPIQLKPVIEEKVVICGLVLKDGRCLEFYDAALVKDFLRGDL